ncbi:hypothetical protein BO78DRAFT_413805 [Aspergillus sclerotiicarbonarius CBS 121057]|uniref:F-box domain-containing protein n=1 Tax=Aspergillus sclerotiicarbonarius (strain CBS 121057 / IBT 28362) TaxID=1448318 RepID=A0A319F616_ASPSB|nr:hypothetical protein BO78DRAFT_413805 [Aspergillus sclerotiicarbonarius CBS 121057]
MTPNDETLNNTAVQRALMIPEVLGMIFRWIRLDYKGEWLSYNSPYNGANTLYSCILVSNLWYQEAIRYLWQGADSDMPFACNTLDLLGKIAEPRRQLYAKFIKSACLTHSLCRLNITEHVEFPNLMEIYFIEGLLPSDFNELHFVNNRVERIIFESSLPQDRDSNSQLPRGYDAHLADILPCFPHLKTVHFVVLVAIEPYVTEEILCHLPIVKIYGRSYWCDRKECWDLRGKVEVIWDEYLHKRISLEESFQGSV